MIKQLQNWDQLKTRVLVSSPSSAYMLGLKIVKPARGVSNSQNSQGSFFTHASSPCPLSLHRAHLECWSNEAIIWPQAPFLCPGDAMIGVWQDRLAPEYSYRLLGKVY